MRVYISGPMTGYPDLNYPAFDKARDRLLKQGFWWVISPADLSRKRGKMPYKEELRDDLKHLLTCQAIFMLKDWYKSNGARLEYTVAHNLGFREMFE